VFVNVATQDIARYANFESSDDNQASVINEDLCPKGKFGYDARCRPWYNDAKVNALKYGSGIHITSPYRFATVAEVGTTAASPLVDPRTGEFVGVTSADVDTSGMQKILEEANFDYTFAVTMPNVPPESNNTVAASNMPRGSTALALHDVLIPYDSLSGPNRKNLISIMERMDEGKTGTATLKRTNGDGVEEIYAVVYSPIYIRELNPRQPDDFTRGANASNSHLFSVVMMKKEDELYDDFHAISDDILQKLERTSLFFLVVTAVISVVCIVVTATVSKFI
jgi:hypothetical protein